MTKGISKRTGTFESFDGTPVYYEVRGEGKPIILSYGIACLINHWTHQLKFFSREYQTIVFDYRGHQQTPAPLNSENLTIDAICQDMKGLAEHLGIQQASYWGHSYGVQILLRYYEMYPETVANMVFINGFATNPVKGMFGTESVASVFKVFKDGYHSFPETLSRLWRSAVTSPLAIHLSALAGGFNTKLTSLKDIEVYARGVAAMDLNVFITLFEQMMSYDASPVLDRIDAPVLIISGDQDGVTPMEHQVRMHERIRGSQLVRVPYGSHCTQLDLPEFVNMRIEKFLNEVGYGQGPAVSPPQPKASSKKAVRKTVKKAVRKKVSRRKKS